MNDTFKITPENTLEWFEYFVALKNYEKTKVILQHYLLDCINFSSEQHEKTLLDKTLDLAVKDKSWGLINEMIKLEPKLQEYIISNKILTEQDIHNLSTHDYSLTFLGEHE